MRNYMSEFAPRAIIPIDWKNPCNESAIYSFLIRSLSEMFDLQPATQAVA
jgi:hypothetical protein